jgi:cytoskeletal protein CcmA (bactofilin family)
MADPDPTSTDQVANDNSSSLEGTDNQEDALESPDANALEGTPETDDSTGSKAPAPAPPQKPSLFKRLRQHLNVYLLLFIFILLVAGIIILIAYQQNRHASTTSSFKTQNLSQSALQQLANSDATVGSGQSILNVQSSAVFAGQVLVRKDLQVAGNLSIGGTVALNNITVAGTSQLGQVTINKNLSVAGDSAVQGASTVSKSLQVNGGGTFGGALSAPQITTSTLQLNGDLVLTHHLTAGGATPSRSGGPALGSGGSVSVGGSDTAGSISINTGSGPSAGCFVTITFTAHYNATPHVLVTPVGSAAGGLGYYINRSSTNFSVCTATPAPGGSSFGFDYFVVD